MNAFIVSSSIMQDITIKNLYKRTNKKVYRLLIIIFVFLSGFHVNQSWGSTYISHLGDTDPTTEGWSFSGAYDGFTTIGPLSENNTLAWNITDKSLLYGSPQYSFEPPRLSRRPFSFESGGFA